MSFTKKMTLLLCITAAVNQSCIIKAMSKELLKLHEQRNSTPSVPSNASVVPGSSGIENGVISPINALLLANKETSTTASTSTTTTTTTEPTTTTTTTTEPTVSTTAPTSTVAVATTAPVVYTTSSISDNQQPSASDEANNQTPVTATQTGAVQTTVIAATTQKTINQQHPIQQQNHNNQFTHNNAAPAHPSTQAHPNNKEEHVTGQKNELKKHEEQKHEMKSELPKHEENIMHKHKSPEIVDQEEILKTLEIINAKDAHRHQGFSEDSLNLLFNNFLYFKEFIITNFEKKKLEMLAIEFINQLYPTAKTLQSQLKNETKNVTTKLEDDMIIKAVETEAKTELFQPKTSVENMMNQEKPNFDNLIF